MLGREGQLVTEAVDGLDCISKFDDAQAQGLKFDVILMDNEMPIVNGEDIVTRLRSRGCTVPIFGLTGHTRLDEIRSFMAHGVDAVLPKPLSIGRLVSELDKFNSSKPSVLATTTTAAASNAIIADMIAHKSYNINDANEFSPGS
jgi:CheY-like chemotaxis protein